MKRILAILSLVGGVTYSKCSKDELKGNEMYRVVRVEKNGDNGIVKFRRYRKEVTVAYQCLPDSIEVGKLMMLPAYE